jgi:hypothetical protein
VFTARYAQSPYIKQISFVFKGLIQARNEPVFAYNDNTVPVEPGGQKRCRKEYRNVKLLGQVWIYIKAEGFRKTRQRDREE